MSRKNSAGSSLTDLVGVQPVAFLNGGIVPLWPFPELAGSETFPLMAGEMACLSGAIGSRIGLTRPGTDASGYGVLGFTGDNASNATSSVMGVFIATPDAIFCGNVGHGTSALAQTAALDVGQQYGLTSLSGRTYVDKSKGVGNISTAMVRVLGFNEQDIVPCFYGRVLFQVLANNCQLLNNTMTNASGSVATAV